jgi:hypothetical protein
MPCSAAGDIVPDGGSVLDVWCCWSCGGAAGAASVVPRLRCVAGWFDGVTCTKPIPNTPQLVLIAAYTGQYACEQVFVSDRVCAEAGLSA